MEEMLDAPRGEGRTGRAGFVSAEKERMRERESGMGAVPEPERKGEWLRRRIFVVGYVCVVLCMRV